MELQKDIFRKALEVIEMKDSIHFAFNTSNSFSSRLIEFINLERECCPFFSFKLNFMPHHGPVILEIGGAKEMLKFLM